jgi:hypothetical protein
MEVEIAPEPTEAERAVLAAFSSRDDSVSPNALQSAWLRAALEEGIGADDGYDSAPFL